MSTSATESWTLPGRGDVELFAQAWLPEEAPRDVVVIAHGYAEHAGRYGNVVERLLPLGFAIYGIDHRGHGRSGGTRAVIDRMAWVIEDLHGLVAQVRARHGGQQVKLLGHSMGGSVAFGYALRYPEDLSGLVLSGPAIGGFVPLWQRILLRVLSAIAPRLGTVALPAEAVSRDPAVVAAYLADPLVTVGKIPARTGGEMVAAARSYLRQAPAMKVPVLIQHGSADSLVPLAGNRQVVAATGATDKTVLTYDGLFHEIYNEPEKTRVLDDLVAWLEAHLA